MRRRYGENGKNKQKNHLEIFDDNNDNFFAMYSFLNSSIMFHFWHRNRILFNNRKFLILNFIRKKKHKIPAILN